MEIVAVGALIGVSFIQKRQLLSFGVIREVGLNDPRVEGSVTHRWLCAHTHTQRPGMAQFKCRFWIVTHCWEQEKG